MATDIEVIVSPAVASAQVTVAPAQIATSVIVATGAPGPAGADASVTATNIASALGYVPDAVGKITLLGSDTQYLSAQAAFDAAYSNPFDGKILLLPEGNFTIHPSADWPDRIQVAGCGVRKTTLTITGANGVDGSSNAPTINVTDYFGKSLTLNITGGVGGFKPCGGKAFKGGGITVKNCFGAFLGGSGGYGGGDSGIDENGNYFCPEAASGGDGGDVTLIDSIAVSAAGGMGGPSYSDPNQAPVGNNGVVKTISVQTIGNGDITLTTLSGTTHLSSNATGETKNIAFPDADGTILLNTTASFAPLGNYATLVGGTVPSSQLPSYVDDVLEFSTLSGFPTTGESGKIYTAIATNKIYRWSGSTYIEISPSPGSTDSVTEGLTNLYFTSARAISAVTWSTLTGKPTFAAVATSGSYADLSNKPSIPAAQVQSDWNASSGLGVILNKPTLFSGAYADLTGKPTLFSGAYADLTGKPTLFSGAYADLTGKPTLFSGAYADLTGKPTLFSGAYSALTGTPSTFTPSAHASSHGSGGSDALSLASSQITGLSTVATSGSASDLSTGTLADARLSSNVALLTSSQTLTNKTLTTPLVGNGTTNATLTSFTNNVLAVANSTTACGFSIFNTRTDASNFEAGIFDFTTNANALTIGTTKAGTGTARRVRINSAEQIDFYCTDTSRLFQVSTSAVTCFSTFNWQFYSGTADPTTSTTPFSNGSGYCAVYKNTTTGVVSLWVRDGSTMKKVALA
jgi:hypothetical protein